MSFTNNLPIITRNLSCFPSNIPAYNINLTAARRYYNFWPTNYYASGLVNLITEHNGCKVRRNIYAELDHSTGKA